MGFKENVKDLALPKITWPGLSGTFKMSIAVILALAIVGTLVFILDMVAIDVVEQMFSLR